jgi:DNA-binding MarR family transcriptional regulator
MAEQAVARAVAALEARAETSVQTTASVPPTMSLVALAEALAKARLSRADQLPGELFGEPAWDILLDLYVWHGRKRVSIGSACIASNMPQTTALRWITALEAEGLVSRSADQKDGRRIFLALTDRGLSDIEAVLATFRRLLLDQ